MKPSSIAFLHLLRRPFSTGIVLLGMILAVMTSGVLLKLYTLTNERFESLIATGDAIVGAKSGSVDLLVGMLNFEGAYPEPIPANLYRTLKDQESIHFEDKAAVNSQQFIRAIFPFTLLAKADGFRVYATSADFFGFREKGLPELEAGTSAQGPDQVVVGSQVAESLHLKVGDALPARTWIGDEPSKVEAQKFKVVGIFKESGKAWDRVALVDESTKDKIFQDNAILFRTPWKTGVLHFMLVYLNPDGLLSLKSLINQRTVAQAISVNEGQQRLQELTGTGKELGLLVAAVILLLGLTSVASMLIGRFESMSVQLAILRTLGYSKKDLRKILIWETLLMAFIACFLGGALDGALFPELRQLLGSGLPSAEILPMGVLRSAPVWGAVILGSLVSILYPLWRVSKQDIHTSLRNL